jgi:predicted nucleic acid-binding protein
MGLILDTSAVIAWERSVSAGHSTDLARDTELAMPAIVWAEALTSVRFARTAIQAAQRRARLETLRHLMGVEPFTPAMAEHYADIFAELSSKGRLIPQNDIAVAATARCLSSGVLVAPSDETHFRKIAGLDVRVLA